MQLIRQFDNFHKDKKTISVGFIGYPNVGKSSVINSLKKAKVCKSAPIPGETKVWQYISLTKRIYLIDCPGVVYNSENETDVDVVLKGIVRAERLEDPTLYINGILKRTEKKDLKKLYEIGDWETEDEFLNLIAEKKGRLLKVPFHYNDQFISNYLTFQGAEADIQTVARILIYDWQRGKIPYFTRPPVEAGDNEEEVDDKKIEENVDNKKEELIEEKKE